MAPLSQSASRALWHRAKAARGDSDFPESGAATVKRYSLSSIPHIAPDRIDADQHIVAGQLRLRRFEMRQPEFRLEIFGDRRLHVGGQSLRIVFVEIDLVADGAKRKALVLEQPRRAPLCSRMR